MQLEPYILFEKRGWAGIVTLNRPLALNALNLSMVRAFNTQLHAWADDGSVTRIIVKGSGTKAFCAGGDLRNLYELVKQEHFDEVLQFFKEEFQLIHTIKTFPKPYIALIDGIVMGAGFGLSAHGSHRVAGDGYQFAMPEVSIGFFPDVGATYVLPRLPNYIGKYIALTGEKIDACTALNAGLLTQRIASVDISEIISQLVDGSDVDTTLHSFSRPLEPKQHVEALDVIRACFNQKNLLAIIAKLEKFASKGSEFAQKTFVSLHKKSPASLAVTIEQMHRGHDLNFESALKLELQIISKIIHTNDFLEGIRAIIIDKDQKPVWTPPNIKDISQSEIDKYFIESPDYELHFA